MNQQLFWFISTSPVWPDHGLFEYEGEEGVDSSMPVFYSTRERAEAEQREFNEAEWEDMPFGGGEAPTEQSAKEDPPEPPALEVFAMETWLLAEHLRDSAITQVKLDDEIISADDFLADFSS